jgi:hypothetical protein
MARSRFNIFRNGKVHVQKRMCDTCIFRPGNLMHLRPGTVEMMVAESVKDDASIPCLETLDGGNSVCRGLFRPAQDKGRRKLPNALNWSNGLDAVPHFLRLCPDRCQLQ